MKKKDIFHPRLYYSIDRMSGNSYKVQYYANIFDDRGNRLLITDKQDFVDQRLCHLGTRTESPGTAKVNDVIDM